MTVLMLFNEYDSLTCEEIEVQKGIPSGELKRTLQSLSLAKYRVLTKDPKTKDVSPSDIFSFNDAFSSRNVRIRIQTVAAQKEANEEKLEINSKIEADRKPQIEAAIVRVMKSRRTLDHNTLVVEVTEVLRSRFQPSPADIKKRIESLIDREFLVRDADNEPLYKYVA